MRMDRAQAESLLGKMRGRQVAVLGDLMLDEYLFGEVSRISPEAPVPVLSDDELRKLLAACEGAALSNAEAETPWLWLGPKGHLTDSGLRQMLERRGEQAGIGHVYPHQFRHTAAHKWLAADGGEGDLMMLMGWRSRQMLNRMAPARRKSERAQLINGWLFAGRCR